MFFAKIGEHAPGGVFSLGHFVLFSMTALAIAVGLVKTRKKSSEEIKKIIRIAVIVLWILEIARISFKLYCGDVMFFASYMPLFFCSIFLYSGLFSAFGKGKVKRAGDVVLSTGSLIGGIVFIIYPATSLPDYPAFHFVSFHSFIYHGSMVYVGLLMLVTRYIEFKENDIWLYAVSVLLLCAAALLVNNVLGCNLMFISEAFPGPFGKAAYDTAGVLYTPLMILVQATAPYYVVYGIYKKISA